MKLTNSRNRMRAVSVLLCGFFLLMSGTVVAEIKTKAVTYKDGNVTLKGELVWDTRHSGKRPGILVVDEWWGLTDWAKDQARDLAASGYVAFAADMYGEGKTTNDPKTAGKWMHEVTGDKKLWLGRARLALDILKAEALVDPSKLAAMGSSFGGITALEMAYAGFDIKAAVVIASAQTAPPPEDVHAINARLLIFFGSDDASTPTEKIVAVKDGLAKVKADWQIVVYSGTRHSFTNPAADKRGLENLAYNETSAQRARSTMMSLFEEAFK